MAEERYTYLEHTADVKFRAYGKTLEEAFSNAALAMTNIITDVDGVKALVEAEMEIESATKEALLYDFMQELIFLLDTEKLLVSEVSSMKITREGRYMLKAKVSGDYCRNYATSGDIKSATYNFMLIEEHKDDVMIQMVLDI